MNLKRKKRIKTGSTEAAMANQSLEDFGEEEETEE